MKLSRDQIQLALSLSFNGITKLPAILVVTSILPLIKNSLGLENYSFLLAALAFGSFFTVAFGGINAVGRRLVGMGFAHGDAKEQADSFVSAAAISVGLAAFGSVLAVVLCLTVFSKSMPAAGALVALFPITAACLNLSDNIRASYNEHYVTAGLQFIFQIAIYSFVIALHPHFNGMIAAALVIQSPFILSSSLTLALLLVQRPYLLKGRLGKVAEILHGGFLFSIADGALAASISVSVFLLGIYGSPNDGAWYGTLARLFQSVLAPVLLFMVPLSAFITSKWSWLSVRKRNLLIKIALAFGLAYGAVVAVALSVGGNAFLSYFYHIGPIGSPLELAAISIFFMAVVSEKAYAMVIYAVDNGRFLAIATFSIVVIAALLALLGARWTTPLQTLCIFSLIGGLALLLVISLDAFRRHAGEKLGA